MAQNGMSVGRDYSLGYYDANSGEMIDLGDVQDVHITAQKHPINSEPYNDDPKFDYIENGYSFRFTITRTGPALEDFQLAAAQRFRQGLSSKAGYLNETVTEADGSVSRYQYVRFVFHLDDIGTINRNSTVKMSAEGMASYKKRVS